MAKPEAPAVGVTPALHRNAETAREPGLRGGDIANLLYHEVYHDIAGLFLGVSSDIAENALYQLYSCYIKRLAISSYIKIYHHYGGGLGNHHDDTVAPC